MGPETEPRGTSTPDDTGTWKYIEPSRTTCCFLFDRKLFNQVKVTFRAVPGGALFQMPLKSPLL